MRIPGAQMLSDYAGGKVIIKCDCGISGRYDANEMMAKTGDVAMTDLLVELAKSKGCTRTSGGVAVYDRCKARYDIEAMRMMKS